MARAYPIELRVRVIEALENGARITKVSKLFRVSRDTIYKWKILQDKHGSLKATSGYQKGHSHKIKNLEDFKEFFELNIAMTSKELAKKWCNISPTTILQAIKKLGYSYKKTHLHPKRDIPLRHEFIEKIKTITRDKIVYLDESGIEDNACKGYGCSILGERCYGEKVYQHKTRISMIAGLCNCNLIAPVIFEGNCNKEVFEAYIREMLIKELKPGQTVVMDNINFHKNPKVKELIESVGCYILFLPTYSPDLNPIEHYWFKIKNEIRKTIDLFDTLYDAVFNTIKLSAP
ncbi:IS630 family transposase [Candidatus Lariskella endosymbiont of Hedychridium roseum]|uniref:IS630 family transposase n=1 Tax=Candidatus Lariskella endosymbiont of Hedychridium roseum TaxID=3077949 RepID=UPI0030CA7BC2